MGAEGGLRPPKFRLGGDVVPLPLSFCSGAMERIPFRLLKWHLQTWVSVFQRISLTWAIKLCNWLPLLDSNHSPPSLQGVIENEFLLTISIHFCALKQFEN